MNFVHEIHLAWRLLVRDWRAGEVTLIAAAIVIAVAAVTTVGFFTDRVQRALRQEANRLLGADLAIGDSSPIAPELAGRGAPPRADGCHGRALSEHGGARRAQHALRRQSRRGRLSAARGSARRGAPLRARPPRCIRPGAGNGLGGRAPVHRPRSRCGRNGRRRCELELRVAAIVTQEPGVALGFLSGQPRLMLNAADLPATGLIQPGSRVRYSLQIAGEAAAVDAYRAWVAGRLAAGQRMEGVRDARPEIRSALDRAERFLNLAVLTTVMLAAAAVASRGAALSSAPPRWLRDDALPRRGPGADSAAARLAFHDTGTRRSRLRLRGRRCRPDGAGATGCPRWPRCRCPRRARCRRWRARPWDCCCCWVSRCLRS